MILDISLNNKITCACLLLEKKALKAFENPNLKVHVQPFESGVASRLVLSLMVNWRNGRF
jgi:hypothetical protein